ncbi:MAG: phosphatase PAP2 family protein [Clostridia bacterium]|nr:phosphatase PAP2 family protein [Clostridia bacterium]
MKKHEKRLLISLTFLIAFILWTICVAFLDVQAIGPNGSFVGLANINQFIHQITGVHFTLYTLTDWLGLIPIGVCMGFGILGLVQWIKRKHILLVDRNILALGVFYILVMAVYILFEYVAINYRPVLIEGFLEASYPSSTTLLVMCVMSTAAMQCDARIRKRSIKLSVTVLNAVFTAFMVIGRLISGVHWFSDIVGSILLSCSLVMLYSSVSHIR